MAMVDIENVSKFTDISESQILTLSEILELLICHEVFLTTKREEEQVLSVGVGVGTIYIKFSDSGTIRYRFVPTKKLEKSLVEALKEDNSKLISYLSDKVDNTLYKKYMEEL